MELEKYCNGDYYIICSCEGTAEEDVINWLLDEDKLLFSRKNLVGEHRGKVTRLRTAKKIENKILGFDFDKSVVIFRIIDSKNEKFQLGNLYRESCGVVNYVTNPEIEILIITINGDLQKYMKKFSRIKASEYAKDEYKIKNIKQKGTFREVFGNDVNLLVEALKEHKRVKGKNHLTIYDLIRESK